MKKNYKNLEIEVITFDTVDVIAESDATPIIIDDSDEE